MNKLFFDIGISGHHSEYIDNIVTYLKEKESVEDHFFFIIHFNFIEKFPHIYNKVKGSNNITFVEIKKEEYDYSNISNKLKKSFRNFSLMNRYAKYYKADEVFLLSFNRFQIPLALKKTNYDIKGILFLQFFRMSRQNFVEKIKYYRKYLTTKFYLRNKSIKSIFILNDTEATSFFNRTFNTKVFKVLKDPVSSYEPLKSFDIYQHYKIEKGKKIFLHFGSLSSRKGTLETLDSLNYLSEDLIGKVVLLLVGKNSSQAFVDRLNKKIENINDVNGQVVIWDNTFVPNEQMKSLFDQCFSVVIPYKNSEASSGVLGNAIASGKIVITTGKGLLKELVAEYKAGLLIDEVLPELIAEKISSLLTEDLQIESKIESEKYIFEHSLENFSETLLSLNE